MPLADRSSKAYIARIKGGNIIRSMVLGLYGGIGYQLSLLEAKIASVIETPPRSSIRAPSNLEGSFTNGLTTLTWKNNATGVTDTRIEIFELGGTGYVLIRPDALGIGSAETYTFGFGFPGFVRVFSITANGTSPPSNILEVVGGA
jgi:hypothetical protein